MQQHIFASRII